MAEKTKSERETKIAHDRSRKGSQEIFFITQGWYGAILSDV